MGLLERIRGRRHGVELRSVQAALAALRDSGIDARLLEAPADWEGLRRRGSPCACVLEPELRRGDERQLSWPVLLRFSPGSELAHISEWRPLAERIVAVLGAARFDARWRGRRSEFIEVRPRS